MIAMLFRKNYPLELGVYNHKGGFDIKITDFTACTCLLMAFVIRITTSP